MKLELTAEFIGNGTTKQAGAHEIHKFYVEADKDTDYPTKVEFQFFNDKIDLSSINVGDKVTVHFNINSRVWDSPEKGKLFFQNLTAWKIEVVGAVTPVKKVDPLEASQEQLTGGDLPF